MAGGRSLAALALILLLAACGRIIPPTVTGPAPPARPPISGVTALSAGLRPGPHVMSLRLSQNDAVTALASFRESCGRLVSRTDNSGLTQGRDWKPACDAAGAGWAASGVAGVNLRPPRAPGSTPTGSGQAEPGYNEAQPCIPRRCRATSLAHRTALHRRPPIDRAWPAL